MLDADEVKRFNDLQRQAYIRLVGDQGEKAAVSGEPMSACPYPMCRDERLWWRTGYENVPV